MKKLTSFVVASGLVLGISGVSLAANPSQNAGPTPYQIQKLEVVQALEQRQDPVIQRSTMSGQPGYVRSESAVDSLLYRLYNGEAVSDQEIDNALRR